MTKLEALLTELRAAGARHVKRGYRMVDATLSHQSNALIEEAAELQAEILDSPQRSVELNKELILKEASHVLSVFVHLMVMLDIPMEMVGAMSIDQVKQNFSTDPAKVTALHEGFNRSARSEPKESERIPMQNDVHLRFEPIDRPDIRAKQCPACSKNHDIMEFDAKKPFVCDCGARLS